MRSTLLAIVALASLGAAAQSTQVSDAGMPMDGAAPFTDIAELDLDALLQQDVRGQKVTAVSRREETVGDAPATVSVLTRDDFVRHDWRSVAEALRSVPGLYVSYGRDYYSTGVRGLSFPGDVDTRILVLVDGHRFNDPRSAQSNTNELLTLPPDAIERIEVIRGPASSVYGSNAFLAVVNIVSRRPSNESPQRVSVDLLASSTNLYRASLSGHGRTSFGLEAWGFAQLLGGDGPTVLYETASRPGVNRGVRTPSQGLTRGTDFERGAGAGLTVAFKGLSLTAQLRNRHKGLPSAPGDSIFNDPYNSVGDQHFFAEAAYRVSLGRHAVSLRAYLDRFRNLRALHRDPSDWAPDSFKWGDPRVYSEGNADQYGGEAQGTFALGELDTLIAGIEVVANRITQPTYELDLDGLPDATTLAGGSKDGSGVVQPLNFAGYLQNDWRPHPRFGLVVGARYDVNTVFFRAKAPLSALAPRATLIFKATPDATLKLAYGEAFRYPTVFEAFFDDAASVCGNSTATPERQRTAELSGVYHFKEAYNLSASVYVMQLSGLLLRQAVDNCYVGSGPRQQFVNAGNVLVLGGEAALDVRLQAVNLFANVSASHATLTEGTMTSRPPNSPTLVAGAGVALPIVPDHVTASLRANFVSGRLDFTRLTANAVPAALRVELSTVGRKLWRGLFAGATSVVQLKLSETPGAPFRESVSRDPVGGADSASSSVPQNLVEVRAHVGFEL